jgi:hypothetical protein
MLFDSRKVKNDDYAGATSLIFAGFETSTLF